jgi:hypothetical protein
VIAVGSVRRSALAVLLISVLVGVFAGATPASAASPWWHLNSGAKPTIIQPGTGNDEVQEIVVSATAGEYFVFLPEFVKFAKFNVNATVAEVQTGLDEVYGAGNVQVASGRNGGKSYTVTFTGSLADRPVPLMLIFGEGVNVAEVTKGAGDGQIVLTVANLGDGDANGAGTPVSIVDKLPPGLEAVAIRGLAGLNENEYHGPVVCSLEPALNCTFAGTLPPYEEIEVDIAVNVRKGATSGEINEASVSGGGARPVSLKRPVMLGAASTLFGVENYEMTPEEDGGGLDTQAGSHPFQLTTTLMLNQGRDPTKPPSLAKDLIFKLPPGLIGNPTPFPQCSDPAFLNGAELIDECPDNTVVGIAAVTIVLAESKPNKFIVPLFNLKPQVGEPARFGFFVGGVQVVLDTSVRTGGDYGVTVSVDNITQTATFMSSRVTFWGVPGDPRHDNARGWNCIDDEYYCHGIEMLTLKPAPCIAVGEQHPRPLLTSPTSCTGPLLTSVEADSWKQPGAFGSTPSEPLPAMDGCDALPFNPSISVAPDSQAGSTPTGLTVGIHVPQDASLNPKGLAEAEVKDTTVALPHGVVLNPAAADGLQACSTGQVALESAGPSSCPEASKVGTVEIHTPLLPNPLVGAAYLAAQNANPFGSLVALYVFVEDPVSGSRVKLAGEVKPDPVTGQLVSTFKSTPQLPFEDFELHFFGGDRAPLGTPALCGGYTTTASIAPWSGNAPAEPSSEFQIVSGPSGSPCADPLGFNPSLTAGTTSIQAGGFSPFTMTMSRADGQQNLQAIQLKMPPGLSGLLSSVKLCGEPQADQGLCGKESEIGETIVSVGLGGDPYSVRGGKVFITSGYEGAPYGLSIVNPAKAGPYDLEKNTPCDCVVVRAKIEVDPITAALTITSDNTGPYKIPTILQGIPLQIKHVNVTINRPGFTFNPTNCNPMSITGSLSSTEGAKAALSVPLQVTNCAVLGFKPGFKVSTSGRTSRAKGASLSVKLTYPKAPFGSQANIAKVKVDLPRQLPSRLTTLQKACPDNTFNQNPATCPAESRVGTAKATTPLLPVPLTGPAYFVSHGGAKFPELVIVLSGYGTTIQLHAETYISPAGITSSTFRTVPDAPVGSFELTLPQGKYSALAANGNLCKSKLKMPTAFTAQNGAMIKQSTPINVTGCTKQKTKKARKRTIP